MAMPKKGTREIEVSGNHYRWTAKTDKFLTCKNFIIESIENDQYQITGGFEYTKDLAITPDIIHQAIILAKAQGWEPGKSQEKRVKIDSSEIIINTNTL